MTGSEKDPFSIFLRNKRDVSRLQVLAEIAEHQPAVRQQDIADTLGVTPQAISELIGELVERGMVSAGYRRNYQVTKSGIDWMLVNAESLESYARHIRMDIIQPVAVWTAMAAEDLKAGDNAGVYMKDGILYAARAPASASGSVIADAEKDRDVGITHLRGIIDHHEGMVHVCKVPRIQHGGSHMVRQDQLKEIIAKVRFVAAVGLEAYKSLEASGRKPNMFFGSREGVIEAAFHGIDCAIVIVDNEFTDFVKRLENIGLCYEIHDLVLT